MSEPFTSEEIEQVVWRLFATIDARNAENTRLREQAEALAGALEAVSEDASKNHDPRCTDELISGFVMENARVALRAYREANHDAG